MLEAIAVAADLPARGSARARRCCAGGSRAVARGGARRGRGRPRAFRLQLFRPVQPMLAQPADGRRRRARAPGRGGVRMEARRRARAGRTRRATRCASITRSLNDVTAAVPEVVEALRALPARRADPRRRGDRASAPTARRYPFQVTMRRFGRKLDVEAMRAGAAAAALFLRLPARSTAQDLHRPARRRERFDALATALPPGVLRPAPRHAAIATRREDFYEAALARGHEGVMAKALDAPYEAGSRGAGWLKVKRAHTLDLVVLAAEWGSGRRKGWLSQPAPRRRDPASGGFVMLGKTFKGLTDEMLAWQTEKLLGARDRARRLHVCTCGPSWWWRSRSTTSRRARTIRAASRCASRASSATAPTSAPRRPTRSRPCARCSTARPSPAEPKPGTPTAAPPLRARASIRGLGHEDFSVQIFAEARIQWLAFLELERPDPVLAPVCAQEQTLPRFFS